VTRVPTEGLARAASTFLDERRTRLAAAITERQYERRPELAQRYGPAGRAHCVRDAEYHLAFLSDALATSSPALFADYVGWAKIMLAGRGITAEDLAENLRMVREVLQHELPPDTGRMVVLALEAGLDRLPLLPSTLPALLDDAAVPLRELARKYLATLLRGERHLASRLILSAAESGTPVRDLYLHVFQRSQHEVGRLWQMNRISVAQEHYCTAATQAIMSQLYPYIFSGRRSGRTLIVACVAGDLHEIGARVVSDLLEMEGWDTIYLGANVPSSDIAKLLIERDASLLALSTTMTFHVRVTARLIAEIRASSAAKVKIIVGGHPFNVAPGLWRQVGADGWARDGIEAVSVVAKLVGSGSG
jgi:MerR family transcriptional regulator, light-induced transcriptional regulator